MRFSRNGRHPYTVDGSRCGVVFVGIPLGAGCGGGAAGGGGGGPTAGTRFYRYDVQVDGYIKNDGFVNDGDGRLQQKWIRTYNWRATFRNVRIKVVAVGNTFVALNATAPTPARSQQQLGASDDSGRRRLPGGRRERRCSRSS